MIALLAYESDGPLREYLQEYTLQDIEYLFDRWHKFYLKSETNLPFRLFTDSCSDINQICGFDVTKISAKPPVPRYYLAYSDWLRSEMYNLIREPFVYMDLDCFIIRSIDNILNIDKPFGMVEDNAGVLVFKQDFSAIYQKMFKNKLEGTITHNRTGEFIWANIKDQYGLNLGQEWNYMAKCVISPHKVKIMHLLNGMAHRFFYYYDVLCCSPT